MRAFLQYFGAMNYKAETFCFETFWRKDIGKKIVRKMLMKLTACSSNNQRQNFLTDYILGAKTKIKKFTIILHLTYVVIIYSIWFFDIIYFQWKFD
jgi:hypothetical protein